MTFHYKTRHHFTYTGFEFAITLLLEFKSFFADIVAICVGGVIFLTIVLLAVFYRIQKRNHEKKRNELLKRTGIFPAVSDVVSTAQKIAWIKTAK